MVREDGGRTWGLNHPIQLALSATFYVGGPVTLELPDHSLITAYASEAYWKHLPDSMVTEIVRWNLPGPRRPPNLAFPSV